MKYLLIFGLALLMLSCSSTNQSSYFGYNNNPKVEDNSNDEIEVYKTGNNTNYSSDENNYEEPEYYKVTNVYVLPPGYYNPWDYFGVGYPNYFYWNNWRFNRWSYYDYYPYWDYGWYRPYGNHHHYYDHYYHDYNYGGNYDNQTPKRKDYRDFGVSRGDFGSPSRNIISNSSKRESSSFQTGSVRNVNSSNTRSTTEEYNRPSNNIPETQNSRIVTSPERNSSSKRVDNVDRSRDSQPRYEQPNKSIERAPSNTGSSSSSSRGSSNSSSGRSSENNSSGSSKRSR